MKITDKLLKKYANVSPLLPPTSDEEVVEVEIPRSKDDISDKWIQLLQEAEGMDPLTEKPAQSQEEILTELQGGLVQDIPVENIGQDMPTKPPPGKKGNLSTDTLLKMCSKYHDLCHKF